MILNNFLAASGIGLLLATSAMADVIPYDFSFSSGVHTVEGTIFGLDDAIVGVQSATSAIVTSSPLGGGAVLDSSGSYNSFILEAGAVVGWHLNIYVGSFEEELGFACGGTLSPLFVPGCDSFPQTYHLVGLSGVVDDNSGPPIGEPSLSFSPVSAVPLPAAGLLFLTGLGALTALRRPKKVTA